MLKMRVLRLILVVLAILVMPVSAGLPDRLTQTAPQTAAAHAVMLTDLARAGERLVAVGDFGVVLYSDDHGQVWQQAQVPVTTLLTSIHFTSDNQGWITGHDGVLLSSDDAGMTWVVRLDGDRINQLRVESLEAALGALTDELLEDDPYLEEDLAFALEDAELAQEEGPVNPLLSVWFRNPDEGYLLGAYGLALRTRNAGESWEFISEELPNPDQLHLNAITQHEGSLIIAGEAGLLMRSDDQGDSWYELPSPYSGSFFDLLAHDRSLYALGLRGHLFESLDGGFEWQAVPVDTTVSFMGGYSDGRLLAITGLGGTLLTASQENSLQPLDLGVRRHFNAVIATPEGWVLAGEQGIFRVNFQGVAQ
ncbi:MAG: WD40/YVTN/BNR-like repeat-containing protein [Nitrincola lacisaponensis]|uniref:WD40/YVTN/BNR-like repeat-containing protein n=1 Tax=Nitrincola lacisaponensis TaxID=267850 RepID=UPI00391D88EB